MNNNDIITIITPTLNSGETIERNSCSVCSQEYKDIKRIIVDGLSNDNTLEKLYPRNITCEIPTKVISENDFGISDAFNKGIVACDTEVIGILNSDDEYYDEFVLGRVAEAFKDNTVDFVHGDMLFVDDLYGTNVRAPLFCPLTYAMPYNHPTMFLRKRVYDEIGLFDLNFRYAMDFELVCRMYSDPKTCKYKGIYLKGAPLVKMHAGGVSWHHEFSSLDEVEQALKKHGFWNKNAQTCLRLRRLRTRIKVRLVRWGLGFVVKVWRNQKWL